MGVSGELGSDKDYARAVFHKISKAVPLVQPEHLQEIVRDEVLGREQAGHGSRANSEERQRLMLVK